METKTKGLIKEPDSGKKENKLNFYGILKEETRQFCTNTSIHGCKFIAQTDKSVATRFTWTFIIAITCTAAYFLIYNAWLYNHNNLTVTVSDTIYNPIWNYQFPGVTICNINKLSLTKMHAFAKLIQPSNMTVEQTVDLIRNLAQLQYNFYDPANDNRYAYLQGILDSKNISVEEAMWQVRPDCKDLLKTCMWKGRIWRCDALFSESRSSLGICCSTNYYGFQNQSFTGYLPERYFTKPRRISACGSHSGLKVMVLNKPEDYYISEAPTYGVKVLLHDSVDFPGYAAQNAIVPAATQYYISVAPSLTYATDSFKALKISERGCIFNWERPMFIFSNYSWVNCLTECRIVLMNKFCGCVPFFLKNIGVQWTPQDKSCTLTDIKCISAHKHLFFNAMPEVDLPFPLDQSDCYCLPECEVRQYAIETSRTRLSRKFSINEHQFYSGIKLKNHSVINIYFKDLVATRNKRDVSISWYSEMALFGGLLGLCFGFSFTSGFEIIYTFTLKIFLDTFHKQVKVQPEDKITFVKQYNRDILTNNHIIISNNKTNNKFNKINSNVKIKHDIWFLN